MGEVKNVQPKNNEAGREPASLFFSLQVPRIKKGFKFPVSGLRLKAKKEKHQTTPINDCSTFHPAAPVSCGEAPLAKVHVSFA